ncbi:hypothetical protein I6F21_36835 [Bradyrhizobium sp. NBAIM03]|nr:MULTISPECIES: hypothetical protein [Bradyrhizobium]MCA1414626.1 hypothetical protein [Bradyrhizobium sp. NBAIM20]MCA1465734.1 hypothetical protein [Bradyrhizobium sp. NBAIM18]MCA1530587.1 hypothetical protein [Bradyrhizobium yuanmingense]MCA1538063.1 hypothetical protein [Bradyrhizobium sp. NBAIM03]
MPLRTKTDKYRTKSSPFAFDFVAEPLAVFLGRGFAEVIYYEQTLAMRLG